ncbi:MAG: hypothetical protein ABJB16_08540 [Saprospiraceae bacterium]
MSTVRHTEALNTMIHSLEERRTNELNELKAQLHLTGESMKPVNLIKSAANELTGNKNVKSYLLQAGVGLAVGFLTKKLTEDSKVNRNGKLIGNIAEMGLNNLTANQYSVIKVAAPLLFGLLVNFIKNRREKKARRKSIAAG